MAIYVICPICNFHYCAGDTLDSQISKQYIYCPMCEEYLYENTEKVNVIYNENELDNFYELELN